MPYALVAKFVGVWIGGKDIRRNISRKIPNAGLIAFGGEHEIDSC